MNRIFLFVCLCFVIHAHAHLTLTSTLDGLRTGTASDQVMFTTGGVTVPCSTAGALSNTPGKPTDGLKITFTPNIVAAHAGGNVNITIGPGNLIKTYTVTSSDSGPLQSFDYIVDVDDLDASGYFQAAYYTSDVNTGAPLKYYQCVDYISDQNSSVGSDATTMSNDTLLVALFTTSLMLFV